MAEIVLKISAESAEALRRVKEFSKGIEDGKTVVQARLAPRLRGRQMN
jgi:hypothetical protein